MKVPSSELLAETEGGRLRPIGAMLDEQAARGADLPALTCDGVTLSRTELAANANRRARCLAQVGVAAGDVVAIMLPNSVAFVELMFACWTLGATPAPLSWRLPDAELAAILALLKPRLTIGGEGAPAAGASIIDAAQLDGRTLSGAPLPPCTAPVLKAIASSGSTGLPKIIIDRQAALFDPDQPLLGMRPGGTVVMPGPLYHSAPFGSAQLALCFGCHLVIMPRFDARQTLALIERHRGQWLYQVPTMMHRIWLLPEAERLSYDLSSLDYVLHIGAACPIWLKRCWIDWLGPDRIWEVYSGTEALFATVIGGRDWLAHPGSVGRPSPASGVCILDEDGAPLPTGETGEIFCLPGEGRGATYQYLGAQPRARGALQSFGDLGSLDTEGYLTIADRRTDLIISGGANFYPAEIEAALDAYPGVQASVVVGLPDADMGQVVHAILEFLPSAPPLDSDDLRRFLANRLSPDKIPRSIEVTAERLRDDAGKSRRGAWREACGAARGRAHVA